MRVEWAGPALDDLAAIRLYISADSPPAASRIAVQLVAAADSLELFPERGRPGQIPGTRELAAIRPYILVYRIDAEIVQILRVWHGAQSRLR